MNYLKIEYNNLQRYHKGLTFIFLLISQVTLLAQDDLTATIYSATIGPNCVDGRIDLHVNGGFEPYTYQWTSTNPNYSSTTQDISNLRVGTYCVTVTDALCGSASACYDITCCPNWPNSSISTTCSSNGGYEGRIVLNWNVSPIPYDVLWFNSSGQQIIGM